MDKSSVAIVRTERSPDYGQIREAVSKAISLIGGIRDIIKRGQLVLIKPNLAAPPADREHAVVTLPEVSRAVADMVKDVGARAVIAESSAVGTDTEQIMLDSGYYQLREIGYEVVNLKKEKEMIMLPIPKGKVFDKIQSWSLVKEADVIISVPKLKTHDQTEITCAIKNLKGLESDAHKRKTHKLGVVKGVVDLFSVIKPSLTVVDAIICQEGLGPIYGKPVEMDLIMASRDLVAADAICGRIIGFEPREVPITVEAADRGLGNMEAENIEVVGESISSVCRRFLRNVEDNPVEVKDFNWIAAEATCTGCRNTVMSSLVDMRNSKQLEYLRGLTIITGSANIPTGTPEDSIVAVGNCVPKGKRGNRFVEGCPPNNVYVVDMILRGRAKAKRTYAEKGEEELMKGGG